MINDFVSKAENLCNDNKLAEAAVVVTDLLTQLERYDYRKPYA